MANDKVTIWNGGLKFGRAPANGELLIGDGGGFNLAGLTAGSGVTISNTSGAITINATGSGGTVTSVTATSPLASSGGATPDISLGTVGADKGGTGQTSLTANNVLLGNGASAVQFVAPGTSGNLLTSDGTTWQSTPPVSAWTTSVKTSDQAITSNNTTLVNITSLSFNMSANTNYIIRGIVVVQHSSGGVNINFNGPASPSQINAQVYGTSFNLVSLVATNYGTSSVIFETAATASQSWTIPVNFIIKNGANSGNFNVSFRQATSSGNATTVRIGSYIEYRTI